MAFDIISQKLYGSITNQIHGIFSVSVKNIPLKLNTIWHTAWHMFILRCDQTIP